MKAEDILDALPVKYYLIDLTAKTILQSNDPHVTTGKAPCHQQLFGQPEPCLNGKMMCTCEQIVRSTGAGSMIMETGGRQNKRYLKVNIKKIGDSGVILSYTDITAERRAIQELKINNKRLARAENLAGFGSWEIDLDTGTMTGSPGACNIYGVDSFSMPFDEAKKIPLAEYREILDKELKGLVAGRNPYNITFRIKRPNDGELRDIHSVAEYREDKNKVFGIIKDITEKEKYQSALQESIADLRLAQNIAAIGNWKYDPVTRSLSVSEQVKQILGDFDLPAHPYVESFESLTGKEHYSVFKNVVQQAVFEGKPFSNQFKIQLQGNTEKWVEIICRPDKLPNPQGHMLRGTVQDISGIKAVENELQRSNNLLNTLIQNLPDAIYMKDADCRKIIANDSDARNCGFTSASHVIGKTDYELYDRETADRYIEDDMQVIGKGIAVIDREEVLPGPEKRWMLTTKIPLKDKNGKINGLVGIGHDITHRKKMMEELKTAKRKAEESDQLKSVFLANMSHEIRTPLNGILGFSNLICSGICDAGQLSYYARYIETCGQQLTAIIENVIDISLIQSDQLTLQNSRFNLFELIEELYVYYKTQQKEKLVSIDFRMHNFRTKEYALFYSDKNRIVQIMKNLLDNAFKFTDQGYIEFGCLESGEKELIFYVEDSGIGIEESKLALIFENFRQVEEGSTRKYEGAGLGLPIVSGLAGKMGGSVDVKSIPGQGSTFYVTIPESNPEREDLTAADLPVAVSQPEPNGKPRQKLIVSFEDDRASIEYLKSVVGLMGCRLVNFDNPLQGIAYLRNNKADLIFMDVRLPEMSGFEATQLIKNEFPNLPVIIQTAYALKEDREKAFSSGCDEYLAKPVPLKDLKGRIRHFIGEEN